MNSNELYHYGIPGMRWGQKKVIHNIKKPNKQDSNQTKKKRNIVIGTTVAGAALAGIGATLVSKTIRNNYITSLTARALRENL